MIIIIIILIIIMILLVINISYLFQTRNYDTYESDPLKSRFLVREPSEYMHIAKSLDKHTHIPICIFNL